jgi:uncharacterized protein YggL (DUF469 family)
MFHHLKFISYNNTMLSHIGVKKFFVFVAVLLASFFTQTEIVFAQAFVPVIDIKMDVRFPEFVRKFDNQLGAAVPNGRTDSLRDLISGSDPQGLAKVECAVGDNHEGSSLAAYPYPDGNWARAITASRAAGAELPNGVPDGATENGPFVQVNYSHSLRCLLMDIAEYQKLGISVQIHHLLKQYIADAQTKQLNNQLMNQVAAANLDWAKAGNEVNNNGVLSNEAVYNTNLSQSRYNKNSRQLEHITDQATADPASGNPVGSLGICEPWRLDTAANMVRNSRPGVEDPLNYTQDATKCKLDAAINPNDYSKFSDNFNDPSSIRGGPVTFDASIQNPANTPLGSATLAGQTARGRIERQKEITDAENANTGFTPTKECSGLATDPYCLDQQNSTAISPAGQNQRVVTDEAQQGRDQVRDGNTLDAHGGPEAELQSTELNTNSGLYGYDATPLQTSQTAVNKLVQEFYDSIEYGYFGVNRNTTNWAQATMLMIYDEMKFDDVSTNSIVTNDEAPIDTGF